jgi:hypothetical protein
MRRIVLLSLFVLLVSNASAQRRASSGLGFGRSGFGPGGSRQSQFRGNVVRGFGLYPGFPYGFGYGDEFLPFTPYEYSAQPNFTIVQPPPSPAFVQPPREASSVIHEYVQPVPATSPQGERPTFGIVLKDGSIRSASGVFVANNVLHYVDPEERNIRISMDEVDREATRKLNSERRLNLWLPAAPPLTSAATPSR